MEFFDNVGPLGLGSRLKRLSDLFLQDVREIYKESGIDFEPKWFPLLFLLHEKKEITVTEASVILNMTHPHVSLLAKEMNQANLTSFKINPHDGRSRLLTLTAKGRTTLKQLQPLWKNIAVVALEVLKESGPDFLASIKRMEDALAKSSFHQRVTGRNK